MSRSFSSLLFAFLLGSPAAQAAEDDAKAILVKAIKAHGGEEVLSKYQGSRSRSQGKVTIPGVGEVPYTQEVLVMQPDKFKESMELDISGQKIKVVTIANGDKAFIEAAGNEVPITDDIKNALKEAQHAMKAARLVTALRDKSFELSSLGEVKVEGQPAVGVRISSKGHKDVNIYFNKDSGQVVKVERRGTDPNSGKEFAEERFILEYNKPNAEGMSAPRKLLVKRDGDKFLEAEVLETKYLEKIDDNEFKK